MKEQEEVQEEVVENEDESVKEEEIEEDISEDPPVHPGSKLLDRRRSQDPAKLRDFAEEKTDKKEEEEEVEEGIVVEEVIPTSEPSTASVAPPPAAPNLTRLMGTSRPQQPPHPRTLSRPDSSASICSTATTTSSVSTDPDSGIDTSKSSITSKWQLRCN